MASVQNTPVKTPKRRTVLTKFEESYIEEEDDTYVYNETVEVDEYDDDDEDDDEDEDEDEDDTEDTEVEEDDKLNEELLSEPVKGLGIEIIPAGKRVGKLRQFLMKHEVIRKTMHSSIGFVTIYLYSIGVHQTQLLIPLLGLFVMVFTTDYIRFHNAEINRVVVQNFWFLIRESEIDNYNGILYYLAGIFLVFVFLPKDISLMSVLLLSWADTAASTFGRQFGKYTFQISKGKSFAGALASFITGVFSCYLIYGYLVPQYSEVNVPGDILWAENRSKVNLHAYSLVCGAVASFSEFVNLFNIDDNFTIPVLSGYLLYGFVRYLEL